MKSTDLVFFRKTANTLEVVDLAVIGDDGIVRGLNGNSLQDINRQYPDIGMCRGGVVARMQAAALIERAAAE